MELGRETEKILNDAVLVFPMKGEYVLLARKMKKIGKGKLNGYGGGIEKGETSLEAAIREMKEETTSSQNPGIRLLRGDLEKVAIMSFHNTTEEGITFVCKVHVYLAKAWDGEFTSTDDMADPNWYVKDNFPSEELMPADVIWMPYIFSGKKIVGSAWYTPHQAALIGEVKIQEVPSFPQE